MITKNDLNDLLIPIPSLERQGMIVKKLREVKLRERELKQEKNDFLEVLNREIKG